LYGRIYMWNIILSTILPSHSCTVPNFGSKGGRESATQLEFHDRIDKNMAGYVVICNRRTSLEARIHATTDLLGSLAWSVPILRSSRIHFILAVTAASGLKYTRKPLSELQK
jgi:hypothetical protein